MKDKQDMFAAFTLNVPLPDGVSRVTTQSDTSLSYGKPFHFWSR
jgi:hypothetical protein